MGSGERDGDEYTRTACEVTGERWLSFLPKQKYRAGTGRLKVLDEDRIELECSVDAPDPINGSGKCSLRRLM